MNNQEAYSKINKYDINSIYPDPHYIRQQCILLISKHPEIAYCSRATIFQKALEDGEITEAQYNAAKEYYGKLWEYVCD